MPAAGGAERDVRANFVSTGYDKLKQQIKDVSLEVDKLNAKAANVGVSLDDKTFSDKIAALIAQVKKLSDESASIKVKVDTTDAEAKLALVDQLKKRVAGDVNMKVNVSGSAGAAAALAADRAAAGGAGGGGGRGGLLGAWMNSTGAAGNGGIMSFLASPTGVSLIAGLSPVLSALAVSATGMGIGVGGLIGATRMGSNANTQITTLNQQIAQLKTTLTATNAKGQLVMGNTSTRALDTALLAKDQAQVLHIQQTRGTEIGIYKDVQNIGKSAAKVFTDAITAGGKNSFASAIAAMLKPVGGEIQKLTPMLTKLFQASAPYVKTLINMLMDFAKTVIPGITNALNNFAPHLKGLERSFQIVWDVVKGLFQGMGWLAKEFSIVSAAIVDTFGATFVATFNGARRAVDWLVKGFEEIINALMTANRWVESLIDSAERLGGSFLGKVGSLTNGLLSHIGLADGGIIPGYAPGVDSVHAMLSPGEGVLVPEAVRMIGPENILALNAASRRAPSSSGNFAGGGIVGGMGGGSPVIINFNNVVTDPDAAARKVQQMLLNLKRHNGNQALGLT